MCGSFAAAQERGDGVVVVPADGTEAFRKMMFDLHIEALQKPQDISAAPAKTIIVLFGDDSVRNYLNAEVEQAVKQGAALVIASDRNSNRTQLKTLFGVEITGDMVLVTNPREAYEGRPYWPFVRPKAAAFWPVAQGSPQEFFNKLEPAGENALATCNTSVVKRTWLPGGNLQMTPLEGVAGYPPSAETVRHGKLDSKKEFFAVGGKWGEGKVLVLGDHSPFYNRLVLAKFADADDNANAKFSSDMLEWLQSGKEERNRCLFVADGKINSDFDAIPDIDPDLPFNEEFNFLAEAMNQNIPYWEKQNTFNDFASQFLGPGGARYVMRWILLIVTGALLVYCFFRLIGAVVRADPARTLVTHEVAAMIPRGGVLEQRFDSQHEVNNLYEVARDRIREEFAPINAEPHDQGQPPALKIDPSHKDPRQLRKRIMKLWEIAYASHPVKVSRDYWYEVLDQLDSVMKQYEDQWWSFEAPPSAEIA
jgi:hypothetical protein